MEGSDDVDEEEAEWWGRGREACWEEGEGEGEGDMARTWFGLRPRDSMAKRCPGGTALAGRGEGRV